MRSDRGFTLLELMLVLALAAILVTLAMPSLSNLVLGSRNLQSVNRFAQVLAYARNEAVNRQQAVVVCKTSDVAAGCSSSGGWEQGWMVFVDSDRNGLRSADEALLQVDDSLHSQVTLRGNLPVRNYVSYRSDGAAHTLSGGMQLGAWVVCDERGFDSGRSLILSSSGRVRTVRAAHSSHTDCGT